jgi:23S rRNA (uracil1939-C5)-methyltransferase
LQLADRLVIKIKSIAFGGEGVGRVHNFVVFVPFAAPGDELEIAITELKKTYARGKILKIIKTSAWRKKPLCGYYESCGGCCYQHINYAQQLSLKKKQVEEAFQKIGKIPEPPVRDTIASPEIYHYRGKAQCHAVKTGQVINLGFLDISGGRLVNIGRCEIMEETINAKIKKLREGLILQNHGYEPQSKPWEHSAATREALNPPLRGIVQLANSDALRFRNWSFTNKKDARLTLWSDLFTQQTAGKGQIKRVVKGREFLVPVDGFFQANLFLADALVEEVCRLAAASPINTLIDAYCGCGLFALFLSPYAGKIISIELNEKSIKFARANAEKQNVQNAEFIQGDVERVLPEILSAPGSIIDLIILDPPRIGCSIRVLESIGGIKPRRIIYVSCNPATQARDVKILAQYGYTLMSLLPLDMFPQTHHIEVIGLLEYNGKI